MYNNLTCGQIGVGRKWDTSMDVRLNWMWVDIILGDQRAG